MASSWPVKTMLASTLLLGFVVALNMATTIRPSGSIQVPGVDSLSPPPNVAAIDVITPAGRRLPMPPMDGGVIVVISTTCPHCHALLAKLSASGSLPRLHVLSLEGMGPGRALLDSLGLSADLLAPATDPAEFKKAMNLKGTPTLLDISPRGSVLGYEIGVTEATLPQWVDKMKPGSSQLH